MLDVKSAADHMGVSSKTVYRMLRAGEILGYRVRRAWRIDPAAIAGLTGHTLSRGQQSDLSSSVAAR